MYTNNTNDACGAQLTQEHDGQDLPAAFLSHTFTDTQQKWSTDLESKMEYDVILHYLKLAVNINNSADANKENTENTSLTL